MRFLDVCRNPDADGRPDHPVPYLLVVQGDHVAVRSSRVVVPLVDPAAFGVPVRDLTPILDVEGRPFVLATPQIAGVSVARVGPVVAGLAEHRDAVRRAIDILTGDL